MSTVRIECGNCRVSWLFLAGQVPHAARCGVCGCVFHCGYQPRVGENTVAQDSAIFKEMGVIWP